MKPHPIMMKKSANTNNQNSVIVFVHIIFLVALIFSSCNSIKPVRVTGISNFKSINTLSDPELIFDLHIENPNNFGVSISRMKLDLYNAETKLVAINLVSKTKISKQQSVTVPVSMKPSIEAISALLKSEMNNLVRGKVNQKMELRGELIVKKFIFKRKVKIKEAVKL